MRSKTEIMLVLGLTMFIASITILICTQPYCYPSVVRKAIATIGVVGLVLSFIGWAFTGRNVVRHQPGSCKHISRGTPPTDMGDQLTACIVLHNYWMGSKGFEKFFMRYSDKKEVYDKAKGLSFDRTSTFNHCDYDVIFEEQFK